MQVVLNLQLIFSYGELPKSTCDLVHKLWLLHCPQRYSSLRLTTGCQSVSIPHPSCPHNLWTCFHHTRSHTFFLTFRRSPEFTVGKKGRLLHSRAVGHSPRSGCHFQSTPNSMQTPRKWPLPGLHHMAQKWIKLPSFPEF